jgi:hypothetical protein
VRRIVTPLDAWFQDRAALARARRRIAAEHPAPLLFPARDRTWRALVPPFDDVVALARHGLPFQIAAQRRYDRSGRPAALGPALAAGKTIFFPQIHQVLPRVMRLMVALRTAFIGPGREECSFLFLVEGTGREGLGLHHDGDVEAFWLQLGGRRTVTLGAPVPRGTPQDLPEARLRGAGFTTRALPPGSLLYLPPRTPHRVLCYERSLALSLTWSTRRSPAFTPWEVASGHVTRMPAASRTRVWTQVPPVVIGTEGTALTLRLPDGARARIPHGTPRLGRELAMMASFGRGALGPALAALEAHGIVGPEDLPVALVPDAPASLDGWRFAPETRRRGGRRAARSRARSRR